MSTAVQAPPEPVSGPPLSGSPRTRRPRWSVTLVLGLVIVGFFLIAAVAPQLFARQSTTDLDVAGQFAAPGLDHLFGTDEVGRDIFARVVTGTRYSLTMAVAIVLIAAVVGTVLGLIAGYGSKWADQLIMRITDIFFSLPTFVVAMAVAVALGRGMVSLVGALAVVWWPSYARMVRGMVLSIKERPHVLAARAIGVRRGRIVRRHIAPFLRNELTVRTTQDVGYALVAVASLSFIGVGAQPPTPEWGLILSGARSYITSSWSYALFPGLAIVLATTGFALLGDGLQRVTGHRRGGK